MLPMNLLEYKYVPVNFNFDFAGMQKIMDLLE